MSRWIVNSLITNNLYHFALYWFWPLKKMSGIACSMFILCNHGLVFLSFLIWFVVFSLLSCFSRTNHIAAIFLLYCNCKCYISFITFFHLIYTVVFRIIWPFFYILFYKFNSFISFINNFCIQDKIDLWGHGVDSFRH